MNQHSGMASLWTASCLILVTSLLGWLMLRSVMSETQRSQQQMFAAQALASSESLLETAIAQIDSVYSGQDIVIDAAFWRNASNSQCPITQTSLEWQCLKWTRLGVGTFDPLISELAWPESVDVTNSFVLFVRDVRMAPHKIKIMAQISLNSDQPGAGSRATVQQSLYIPISAPWTPPRFSTCASARTSRMHTHRMAHTIWQHHARSAQSHFDSSSTKRFDISFTTQPNCVLD